MANTQTREQSPSIKSRQNGGGEYFESASTVVDAVEKVARDLRKGSADAVKMAQEYRGKATVYAKSHPWQSILAAGLFGLMLGFLMKRRN